MGLKISDGCNGQINVCPPPGGNRVSGETGVIVFLKESKERLSDLIDGIGSVRESPGEKGVFLAGGILADDLFMVLGPEMVTAGNTFFPREIVVPEEGNIKTRHKAGRTKTNIKGLVDCGILDGLPQVFDVVA